MKKATWMVWLVLVAGSLTVTAIPQTPEGKLSAETAIATRCQRQTLAIVGRGSAVAAGRCLWTAAHVVDREGQEVLAETVNGCAFKATVLKCDRAADLAILTLPAGMSLQGPAWCERLPEIGERLFVVGSPSGDQGTVSAGIVSAHHRSLDPWKVLDQTDAAVDHGSSGGGVYLQASGELVGLLVAARHHNHAFYIPVRVMRDWAKSVQMLDAIPSK
jgi:S1-C subfamily serine protease